MSIIPYLSCLRTSGTDAAEFLDAQLTVKLSSLRAGQRKPACWCNAKGQVLASLLVLRETADSFLLVLDSSLLNLVQQRLSLYILRSQVNLKPADDISIHALPGESDGPVWAQLLCGSDHQDGKPRAEQINAWQLQDINAGWCWLSTATSGQFLPQMLAMEHWQALDYKKGCYPGQEVIARAHYLGRLKRSLWRVQWEHPNDVALPAPGTHLSDQSGTVQGQLLISAHSAARVHGPSKDLALGLAVLHDNHIDTVLSYETNGTLYPVTAVSAISTAKHRMTDAHSDE